jgi:exodeoxyribonuclease VII small subunit
MPRSRSTPTTTGPSQESGDGVDDLSFQQARTALELILAELQSGDLEVEAMADLYRRAQRYADRCEAVLRDVEQEVRLWDPQTPEVAPEPFNP